MESDVILEDIIDADYGHWIGITKEGMSAGKPVYSEWQCSVCGATIDGHDVPNRFHYCFNCGKKMRLDIR